MDPDDALDHGTAEDAEDDLVIDPLLLSAWQGLRLRDIELLGLAGETNEDFGRAAVVLVTDRPLDPAAARYFQGELDATLEAPTELITLSDADADLKRLLRQWIRQAGRLDGRGIRSRVDVPPGRQPIQVAVQATDGSARVVAMRLASPNEPALAALETLLGGRPVIVLDR